MIDKNQEKLNQLLDKRRSKLESVSNFYEYFDKFAYLYLKEVVMIIDDELENKTNESLRIFSENPYDRTESRFFIMVQLFMRSHRRNTFFLDNSENHPMIKFEGDEFTGNVKSTISFGSKLNRTKEYPVMELNDKNKVFEIMLNFLDTIYSL